MPHVDVTGHQHGLHGLRQIQQTQQVAGRTARAAHRLGGGLVGQTKLFDEALQTMGLFKRIEVFALNVLNQSHGRCCLIGHIANQDRHLVQTRQSRGAESTLACNDFILAGIGAIT